MSRRLAKTSALALSASALLNGCASAATTSTPTTTTTSLFPSRADVARIAEIPLPEDKIAERLAVMDTWTLTGQAADTIEDKPHQASLDWEKPLEEAAKKRPGEVFPSEAMSCVAREVATILVEKGGFPSMNVRRFISARCGSPSANILFSAWTRGITGDIPTEKMFADTKTDVEKLVADSLPKGQSSAGLYFGRIKDKAIAFMAVQPRRIRLDPIPVAPTNGKVTLKGEVYEKAAFVRAVANKGRYGFSECKTDPTIPLPAFSVTCDVNPEDPTAWVELAVFPPGRLLGHSVVQTLVFPAGKPINEYHFRAAEDTPAIAPEKLPKALLDTINEHRTQAGLRPMALEPAQSRTTTFLAPYFFAAVSGQTEEALADKVVLGVRAGWDVTGTVRFGEIASVMAPNTSSPAQIIDLLLEQPSARSALFAPEATRLAIGPTFSKKDPLLGLLFSTYALLDPTTHTDDANRVIDKIVQKRAAKGLPPPALLGGLEDISKQISLAVANGKQTPEQGLNDFLQNSVDRLGRGLKAWVFEGTTIDLLEPPKELIEAKTLHFAITVTHHKPENEPWARLVVYCLVDPNPQNTLQVAKGKGTKGFHPFTPLGAVHPDPGVGFVATRQTQTRSGGTGSVAAQL